MVLLHAKLKMVGRCLLFLWPNREEKFTDNNNMVMVIYRMGGMRCLSYRDPIIKHLDLSQQMKVPDMDYSEKYQ